MIRGLCIAIAMLALLACQREAPASSAPPAAPAAQSPDAAHPSASLAGVADDATPDSTFVLPGALGADTDVAALRRLFGGSYVRVGEVPGPEGTTAQGVTLFADDPTRRAFLYFQDETARTGLALVSIKDRPSRWRLDWGYPSACRCRSCWP